MIDRKRLAGDVWAASRFRLFGASDAAALKVRARMGKYVEGRQVLEIRRLAPTVMAGLLPRLYPQMLKVAYAHQDAGRPVYVCTAASQEIALALALILGFDGAIGSRMEIEDGVFTGRETGVFAYREGKAQAIRELAAEEGIDLSTSYAYSDAASDLPMLKAVGIPVAVNPDAALGRIARDAGWDVLRFDRLPARLKIGSALLIGAVGGAYASGRQRSTSAVRSQRR